MRRGNVAGQRGNGGVRGRLAWCCWSCTTTSLPRDRRRAEGSQAMQYSVLCVCVLRCLHPRYPPHNASHRKDSCCDCTTDCQPVHGLRAHAGCENIPGSGNESLANTKPLTAIDAPFTSPACRASSHWPHRNWLPGKHLCSALLC